MPVVMIARWLPAEHLDQIRAVDDRIELRYDARLALPATGRVGLMYEADDRERSQSIAATRPFEKEDERTWFSLMADAEVMFDVDPAYLDVLPTKAPRLRWIQAIAAGAGELFASAPLRESSIEIAAARGVHDDALADFALMGILAHGKQLSLLNQQKAAGRWQEIPSSPLAGKTVCIVGFGSIGRQVAHRCRALGLRVIGVKRSPTHSPYAEELFGPDRLIDAVASADFVVITLPATKETYHMIDQKALAAMKPGAFVVNIGRGSVLDENALIAALRQGHLSGAALDVFETEPLPAESPLWRLENVIISPHCTSLMPGVTLNRLVNLFCENLRRHLAGQPPLYCVDKNTTY